MAEAIDELFVKLGLQTEKQQFQQAERQFDSLRTVALQAGAAIGAGFGLNELTFGFAQATDEMRRFSEIYGVAPEFVDKLKFAFKSTGGAAEDAFSSIKSVADLIQQTEWGRVNEQAFEELGVDPYFLEGVQSVADAYDRIVQQGQRLNRETARRFFSAMGLSESELRLARGTGDESFGALMQEAEQRAGLTQSMLDGAQAFTRGQSQLQRSMEGVSREISDLFVGDLGEQMTRIADILDENREAIVEFTEDALPFLEGAAIGIGTLVAIQGSRAALGILQTVPGLTALTAGIGYGLYQSGEPIDRETPKERKERYFRSLQEDFPGIEPAAPEDLSPVPNIVPADEDAPYPDVPVMERPDEPISTSQREANIELNVDARGARDPAATEAAVTRGVDRALARAAENAILDIETGVS